MWFWVGVAMAICVADERGTEVRTRGLGPHTPILVQAGTDPGEDLARRLRVRGPDGGLVPIRYEVHGPDVRLVPLDRWDRGTYQVEERGDYGADGARVHEDDAETQAWFVVARLEAQRRVQRPRPTGASVQELPTQPSGPRELLASVPAGPGVDWVELEVEGVGPIARSHRSRDGFFRLWSGVHTACNCTRQLQELPSTGSFRARVRYVSADGGASTGSWTRFGRGRPAGLEALASWRPIVVPTDDRPLAETTTCGSLAVGEVEKLPMPEQVPGEEVRRRAAWAGGWIEVVNDGLAYHDGRGGWSASLAPTYRRVALEGEVLTVGGVGRDAFWRGEVRCTGEALGVPTRWGR